jgi:hypothetical protein
MIILSPVSCIQMSTFGLVSFTKQWDFHLTFSQVSRLGDLLIVVLFAVPRVAGWLAHWKQQLDSGTNKIWRPRQVYVGEGKRPYVGFEARLDIPGLKGVPHYISRRRLLDRAKL